MLDIPIEKGKEDSFPLSWRGIATYSYPKVKSNIEKDILYPDHIKAPIEQGQKIGEYIVKLDFKRLIESIFVAKSEIGKASLVHLLKNYGRTFIREIGYPQTRHKPVECCIMLI